MRYIFVVSAQRLKQILIVGTTLLLAVVLGYHERDTLSAFSEQPQEQAQGPHAIYKVDTKEKKIALTFDISWGETRAEPILDILKEKNVKASFFLSTSWAQRQQDTVKRIKEDGFEIGSHGHKHEFYTKYSDDEIRSQIRRADSILTEMTGKKPSLIRFPNGDIDKRVLTIANSLGYTVIQWDTDSQDWTNPGTDVIVNNVLSKAHPGDIVLMHASDSSKETHLALPVIIDKLRKQGYEFVTVSELISGTQVNSQEVK
ncbi:polysaccharide deacetylase family sporulation protein PdaB [Brevibacillus panacihumi]|uniref:polysaccharide deacetylase family sporulation protein PdaB n=1 Tax=Brevibacillus panacihumi TaxID=497735 RepID=UPI003D067DFE